MKTTQYFDETIITATIVINQKDFDSYKEMLVRRKVEILEERFVEKENSTVFVIKGLKHGDLHLFDENNAETSYVWYYELKRGIYTVKVSTVDSVRPNKFVSHIMVSFDSKNSKGEPHSQKVAEIFADRELLNDKPNKYTVNWGAWGSMDVDVTRKFADGMHLALGLAEDCQRQFC